VALDGLSARGTFGGEPRPPIAMEKSGFYRKAIGAMSCAFTTTMEDNPEQTYIHLLDTIPAVLETKYTQPELSWGHPLSKSPLQTASL
jgi:hypothetical protein